MVISHYHRNEILPWKISTSIFGELVNLTKVGLSELKCQAEAVNREISIEGEVAGWRRPSQFTATAVTALTALPLWRQFM